MTTRGVKNLNPGNIRLSPAKWQGKVTPSRDPEFEQFETPFFGIRALAVILLTYYQKYRLDTVTKIIARWAPSAENNTGSYVRSVARTTGLPADEPIDLTDIDTLASLAEGIIAHENAGFHYYMGLVDEACVSALMSKGITIA